MILSVLSIFVITLLLPNQIIFLVWVIKLILKIIPKLPSLKFT